MTRTVEEWIGRNDDAKIPDRVKERIAMRASDCCQQCGRSIGGKLRAEFDHIIPLILGGKHAEGNLRLVCNECHALKTKRDVKLAAKVKRIRKKKMGFRGPSRFQTARTGKFKQKMDGSVVLR